MVEKRIALYIVLIIEDKHSVSELCSIVEKRIAKGHSWELKKRMSRRNVKMWGNSFRFHKIAGKWCLPPGGRCQRKLTEGESVHKSFCY